MKASAHRFVFFALLACLVAGCSTPASRIGSDEAAFNSYPADVQAKIRAGEVAVGFTPAQVTLALGKPDRKTTRTTAAGAVEVWGYFKKGPGFSFGFGVGGGGGSTHTAAGVGVTTGGRGDEEVLRIIFSEGKVSAIERATK